MLPLTFIVSCYSRPIDLNLCLLSLRLQTYQDFEVIVVDNNSDPEANAATCDAIDRAALGQPVHYRNPRLGNCYQSSDWAAKQTTSE